MHILQAAADAPSDVAQCRAERNPELFDKALAHHAKLGLRADIAKGTTRDRTGWRSGFVSYDWSETYANRPDHVWHDFFKGAVMNSVSRMERGLRP